MSRIVPLTSLLETRALEQRFGTFQALSGVDLCVQREGVHALIGPNGAGKTTLLRTLAGVHPASQGHIELDGIDITATAARCQRRP